MEISEEIIKFCRLLAKFCYAEPNIEAKFETWIIIEENLRKLSITSQGEILNFENLIDAKPIITDPVQSKRLISLVLENLLVVFKQKYVRAVFISLTAEMCREHLVMFQKSNDKMTRSAANKNVDKVLQCIGSLLNFYRPIKTISKSSTILLCFNQIHSNLPLLTTGIREKCPLVQSYAAGCLIACMERIAREPWEEVEIPCCEFLDLMDVAVGCLDEVAEHPDKWMQDGGEKVAHLKGVIDELLLHSMSIVHVAPTGEDKQIISAKAQHILRCFECLRDEMAGEDESSVRLCANVLSDTLCALERAVNSAVLRLVLYIQCDKEDPLKRLVQECKGPEENLRQVSSLDPSITKFDSYMDKLMQTGNFAVSCTSSSRKSMVLKNCMASFESLEAELIPCISKLYMQNSKVNKLAMRLLVNQWNNELTRFRSVLDTIVDPAAYIEIVKQHIEQISKQTKEELEGEANAAIIKKIIKVARSVISVTEASIDQEPNKKDREKLQRHAQSIVDASDGFERLLKKKGDKPVFIWPGLKHLQRVIDELWEYLAEKVVQLEDSVSLEDSFTMVDAEKGPDYYQLCPANDDFTSILQPQIKKAQLFIKEPVFYNTPKRTAVTRTPFEVPASMRAAASASCRKPMSSVRRRCFRSSPNASSLTGEDAFMDLTHALETVTVLDYTFTGQFSPQRQPRRLDLSEDSDSEEELTHPTQPSASTLMNTNVPTPDRMNDLLLVEEKLEALKVGQGAAE